MLVMTKIWYDEGQWRSTLVTASCHYSLTVIYAALGVFGSRPIQSFRCVHSVILKWFGEKTTLSRPWQYEQNRIYLNQLAYYKELKVTEYLEYKHDIFVIITLPSAA